MDENSFDSTPCIIAMIKLHVVLQITLQIKRRFAKSAKILSLASVYLLNSLNYLKAACLIRASDPELH